MRKLWLGALCVFVLCLCSGSGLAQGETFTLMVYLCGSTLETDQGSATDDLFEMTSAGLEPGGPVTVVVETGGAKQWQTDDIASGQNERLLVGNGDVYSLETLPQRDMADSDTLSDFVSYCIREYPADRYGLILWNHGAGSTSGVCFDEYSGDYLSTLDIHNALSGANDASPFHLDFIAFDACLMATYEMANHVKDFADYMIASVDLVPGRGFDYAAMLQILKADPGMEIAALGEQVCNGFVQDSDEYATLSLLDLSKMEALTEAVEAISAGLCDALDTGSFPSISRNRQSMRSFGDLSDMGSDMIDLRHFIEAYADLSGVNPAAALAALDEAVVYNRYTEGNASGMSILLPMHSRDRFQTYAAHYDALVRYPAHTAFITEYTRMLSEGRYVFSLGRETAPIIEEAAPSASIMMAEEAEMVMGEPDEAAEEILAYSVTLSDEDMENLAYVEGNLMLDRGGGYIDLGRQPNARIDWDANTIHATLDVTWPMLEGQPVHVTDQGRVLIDATVNGVRVYLLAAGDEIIGYTEGYSAEGIPPRGYIQLEKGDIIVPQYDLYYDGEDAQETVAGDPIVYTGTPLAFGYENLAGADHDFAYAFRLHNVFGEHTLTDFFHFSL